MLALKGNVTHYVIPLNDDDGNSTSPEFLVVRFHNGSMLTPGRVKEALLLETSQYITIDEPQRTCFSDLQLCTSGLCLAFYLKIFGPLHADIQLMKSAAYSVRTTNAA